MNPPALSNPSTSAGGADFLTQAKALAKLDRITVTDAMLRLAAAQPDLHERFLDRESHRALRVHSDGPAAGRIDRATGQVH
jgi:hypothetical protein